VGINWAGAAAGAQQAARQQREEQAAQAERDMRIKVLMSQLGAAEDTQKRNARDQQLQEAAITLQQADLMGQGAELSPDVAKVLSGTPYGARVQQQQTLPSRSVPGFGLVDFSDPGGRQYATIAPTQAQAQAQAQRTQLDEFANDPTLAPMMRRWVGARRAGMPVPNPESFETPSERSARLEGDRQGEFTDFTRRADYNAQIQARARRQIAAEAKSAPITGRDRLTAIREADEAASRALNAMQDDFGQFPEGFDAEGFRRQLRDEYLATLEGRTPRNTSQTLIGDESLRSIVPQPTRTGRMMGDYLMPRTSTASTSRTSGGPAIGSVRIINGQRAQWDGHGWLAVQ
jgi:hypothetical protein